MRYLSVCSGIEAASVAWEPLGWQPTAFSEIEAFPAAVLAHHWPSVPNLGDMNKYEEWKLDSIDLLVGGTPCQSFSVAGLRKGLHDPRGGLMLTYLEIARRFRPRWIVWENVPGVLSSNGGRDFGSFLGALGELGYGWAYRVLDAQWVRTQRHPHAVPQRRRRVFVVACLADRTRAAKVLFESQSLRRDYSARGKKKQDAAGTSESCAGGRSIEVAGSLDTECGGGKLTHQTLLNGHALVTGALSAEDGEQGHTTVQAAKSGMLVAFQQNTRDEVRMMGGDGKIAGALAAEAGMKQQNYLAVPARMAAFGEYVEDDTASTMKARDFRDATDLVSIQDVSGREKKQNGRGWNADGTSYTLDAAATQGVAVAVDTYNQTVSDTSQAISSAASDINHTGGVIVPETMPTMRAGAANGGAGHGARSGDTKDEYIVPVTQVQWASGGGKLENPTAQALRSGAEHNYQFARVGLAVRRLTPLECERLQGFPDYHTLIPWKKKPADECPDGPRYKALGNSMAVNCMEWIGQRIAFYDKQS